MKTKRIYYIIVFSLFCSTLLPAQNKKTILESNLPEFEQTMNKFPDLLTSEDWKLIHQKAEAYLKNDQFAEALSHSKRSRILAEKLQDNLLIARSFHQAGRIYSQLADYKQAEEFFQQAARFYTRTEKSPENRLEVGHLLKNWAFINSDPEYINSRKSLNTALFYLAQSKKIADVIPLSESKTLRIETSLQIADCFAQRGNYLAQIAWLEEITNDPVISSESKLPYLLDAYLGLESANRILGDYEDADNYLKKIDAALKKKPDDKRRLKYLRHLADFYTQINYKSERDGAINEGISLARKLNNVDKLADFYSARLLKSLEDKNLESADQYLALLEEQSLKKKLSVNPLDIYVARAVSFGYRDQPQKSAEFFSLAENHLRESGSELHNTLFLLIWQSKIAAYQKDYEKLKSVNERYFKTASEGGSLDSFPLIYLDLSRAYFGLKNVSEAAAFNQKAIDLIEEKRRANSARISIGVMEGLYEAYQQSIDYNLSENKSDEAFVASEFLKARFLSDKISGSTPIRKALFNERAKSEIFDASVSVLQQSEDPVLSKKLSALEESALLKAENEPKNPLTTVSRNLTADLKNSNIDSKAAVISYVFTAQSNLIAFVWRRGQVIRAVPLNLNLKDADELAASTSNKIKNLIFFKQDGNQLFDKLVKPLEISADVKHLIIIPDGSLWRIPFHALSEDGKTYLIENKLVSYAPSVSILLNQLKNPKPARLSFQAYSNSLYKNLYLKYADREAAEVSAIYRTVPKLNAAASDFALNAGKFDINHFSMHAEIEPGAPFDSFLAFKPVTQSDGKLSVQNLLGLKLKPGSLVFLASCETNNVMKGEGLISLAWGMFGAGAGTVISAQWEANDQATGVFTKRFYQNLHDGETSAEALQKTARQMISNSGGKLSDPYFWAEFTLSGDYR